MKKMSLIALVLVALMLFAACAPTAAPSESPSAQPTQSSSEPSMEPSGEQPAETAAEAGEHSHQDVMEYVNQPGTKSDINKYYNDLGIDCNVDIRCTGGDVKIKDGAIEEMPKPNEKYKIGFSVYYTVDEVGSMYLEAMKQAAEEAGIELLINDADYDQNSQDQAIEQWILQDVDGVILTPCDFTGVKTSLDALEKAGIPVVSLDAPPQAGNVDSIVTYDCIEQGRLAGVLL